VIADDGHRHGAEPARDQLGVRVIVFLDVARGERHGGV